MSSRFAPWTSTTTSFSTAPAIRFRLPVLFYLYFVLSSLGTTNAFTWCFTSAPTQCEETSVIWDGGTAPYKLLLLPLGFKPQGVETRVIFERTVDNGNQEGFIFPFPAGSDFVAVMSDATGFGTGGTSPILTVASSNSSSCLPTTPSEPEFYLYLSSTTLNQCSTVRISWDRPATPPVTVYGIIPQGQSFDLNAASHASGGTGFDWTVNIKSGTPFFFVAGDRNGSGKGGSTDVQSIGGGSSRCIDANSPSATADSGVGSVGQLPNNSGNPSPTSTGANSPSGTGNDNGSGNGNGNNDGNNNGDGNGNGNGNGNQNGGTSDGSGGGTVHGPLDPTSAANGPNDASRKRPNLPLILGLVITLMGLGILIGLAVLFYKRRKREQERRDNQRARLLPAADVSEVHLPREPDLPHPRPPFSNRAWPGGSIENLGSALRATPFIWPIGGRDSSSPRDRDPGATGTTTARPGIESRSTSSSGMLRRLRSNRFGGSGIGFPFSGSGGYQSLGDESTPSSNIQNTNTNNDSSGFGSGLATGHNTSFSNGSSASAIHKSPLPASYLQHVSQGSHGSDGSRPGHASPTRMSTDQARDDLAPLMSPGQHTLTRPGPAPLGPRPAPGSSRPSFGRLDTGGSVWEVPPTYDSLRRQQAREG